MRPPEAPISRYAYSVGDTVILERGKPFTVSQIDADSGRVMLKAWSNPPLLWDLSREELEAQLEQQKENDKLLVPSIARESTEPAKETAESNGEPLTVEGREEAPSAIHGPYRFPVPFPITPREWNSIGEDNKLEAEDGTKKILVDEGGTALIPVVLDEAGHETQEFLFEESGICFSCLAYTEEQARNIMQASGHSLLLSEILCSASIRKTLEEWSREYNPVILQTVMRDEAYLQARKILNDENAIKRELGEAIKRAVNGLPKRDSLFIRTFHRTSLIWERMRKQLFEATYSNPLKKMKRIEAAVDRKSTTIYQRNYAAFQRLFPEIVNRETAYIKLQAGEGFMPLVVEDLGGIVSVTHYAKQNGDLLCDPEMTFSLDRENQTLEALTFENQFLSIYQKVYPEPGKVIPALKRELNSFAVQWLKNIRKQGYEKEQELPQREAVEARPVREALSAHERQQTQEIPPIREEAPEDVEAGTRERDTDKSAPLFPMIPPEAESEPPFPEPLQDWPAPEKKPLSPSPARAQNFHITDEHLGEGGQKSKFRRNIEAIRTLKQLEAENRAAKPDDQEILSQYVGWGSLPQAFDEDNPQWAGEYRELQSLLTTEEYRAARQSVLNAHYTSPIVIKAMYSALENMGLRAGNLLEPSCGVGNFLGLLPEGMRHIRLYGVELDSLTGRIAGKLYPGANIQIKGFEQTQFQDNFFDAAVGNVPFGNYRVHDRRYDKHNFSIHNYFFAKTLDKVRPGGVIAFVTSSATMDSRTNKARCYMAERADLLGAVRLPNTAFLANAGTKVTCDILFLQKRDSPPLDMPEWVNLGKTGEGIPVNQYFASHPEMLLGKMELDPSMYGNEKATACHEIPGEDWKARLMEAVKNVRGRIPEIEILESEEAAPETLPADPDVRNYSYTLHDGELWFQENSIMRRAEVGQTDGARIRGMLEIRDCLRKLIDDQAENREDSLIQSDQARLNDLYDEYTKRHGLLNSKENRRAFSKDTALPLLCALEHLDEKGNLERKADIFIKRTIRAYVPVTHCNTAVEALGVCIGEKACVDLTFMAGLTGKTEKELAEELRGQIFRNPDQLDSEGNPRWETADEYLCGNVREKLASARRIAKVNPLYQDNVRALEQVHPPDLTASEISVRLGTVWIPPEIYHQFMREVLKSPLRIAIHYSPHTSEWQITNKNADFDNAIATNIYGTDRLNAYHILEKTLNLKTIRIQDPIPEEPGKYKLNQQATYQAQERQSKLKEAFQQWIYRDPERRRRLTSLYNQTYNCIVPRKYDGKHIQLRGLSQEITLRPYQLDGVARILYGHNALIAHCVGAGKTYTLSAAAMESKTLGLCQKTMITVPNHLTGQWGSVFLQMFPRANVLIVQKEDFEKANRRKFCARIASGNWDAVIIGHSQFQKIPVSSSRQKQAIQLQIDLLRKARKQARAENKDSFTVKQMESAEKKLKARLEKLLDTSKDDVVTFEELGIDRLIVDEADMFKNLYYYTKMENVAGLSQSYSQRASDMLVKCRYINEISKGRGVVFATGTPISNSISEMYTLFTYLYHQKLERMGLEDFDSWATAFGDCVTALELKPEGKGFQLKTRFAKFCNLPELMSMFRDIADIQTADMLNLPRPKAKYHTVQLPPSPAQKEMIQAMGSRADKVRNGMVEPHIDNMLKITGDGRKLALDQRLINPLLPDDPNSKVNACAGNIFSIWKQTTDVYGTQLIFCDQGVPKKIIEMEETKDGWKPAPFADIYNDLKHKLVMKGIPPGQIAFIHEAKTDMQKENLFRKVRQGSVRVLIGSTEKMGAGTNVQTRIAALHHLDVPWRPRDVEQREGRGLRDGNLFEQVKIFRYVTLDTFDAYSWQLLEKKQSFISQIMSGKNLAREIEDVDEVTLSYAEVKALSMGNPLIREKLELEIDLQKLTAIKSGFLQERYITEDLITKELPEKISHLNALRLCYEKDAKTAAEHPSGDIQHFAGITINGVHIQDKKQAAAALLDECQRVFTEDFREIGQYRGFSLSLSSSPEEICLHVKGRQKYSVQMGTDAMGNLTRLDHVIDGISEQVQEFQTRAQSYQVQIEELKRELHKPFPHEQELQQKTARLEQVTALIKQEEHQSKFPVKEDGRLSVMKKLEHKKKIAEAAAREIPSPPPLSAIQR